jgi:uncharacterized surface protein with fasciclin (FAS1) repeats
MRKILLATSMIGVCVLLSCNSGTEQSAGTQPSAESQAVGQSGVQDDMSQKNVVQVAIGSKDHTTLVAAVQAAKLVDALSNAGPLYCIRSYECSF